MSGAHETWRNCGDCGAPVPVEDLVRPWCGACGWNITEGSDLPRSFIDRKIDALGQLHGAWLLNQVSSSPEAELRPRLSVSVLFAFLVSFLILSTNVLIGLAGIYLLVWGWPHVMLIAGGAILLATSWFLRPHLGAMPKGCVARGDFPALFGLVDRIAADLKIKPIEHVRIDEDFNASMAEIGLARVPVLSIGLPLWVSLTTAERVALVGHELAHRANHDPARSSIVGNGLLALDRWNYLLTPPRHATEGLGELVVHGVMFVVAKLTRGLWVMLANLLFIERQRAEYLADHLGAKVAGSAACVSLLQKLRIGDNLKGVVERVYYGGDTDGRSVIEAFRSFASAVPAREMERITLADEKENARIDASHPPTSMRIRFIAGRNLAAPSVILDDAQSAAIDAELRPLSERLSMKIMDRYFE